MTACAELERAALHALHCLPPEEEAFIAAHLRTCDECQREFQSLQPVVDAFDGWPTDVMRPARSLWARVAIRVAGETGAPALDDTASWDEPEWEDVAPGIQCKLLATDDAGRRVSMLVRLAPRTEYPPHRHAGTEELHLLDGELWIDERKLYPGDYNIAPPGTSDKRVWSETGCTCVLITSPDDVLG